MSVILNDANIYIYWWEWIRISLESHGMIASNQCQWFCWSTYRITWHIRPGPYIRILEVFPICNLGGLINRYITTGSL